MTGDEARAMCEVLSAKTGAPDSRPWGEQYLELSRALRKGTALERAQKLHQLYRCPAPLPETTSSCDAGGWAAQRAGRLLQRARRPTRRAHRAAASRCTRFLRRPEHAHQDRRSAPQPSGAVGPSRHPRGAFSPRHSAACRVVRTHGPAPPGVADGRVSALRPPAGPNCLGARAGPPGTEEPHWPQPSAAGAGADLEARGPLATRDLGALRVAHERPRPPVASAPHRPLPRPEMDRPALSSICDAAWCSVPGSSGCSSSGPAFRLPRSGSCRPGMRRTSGSRWFSTRPSKTRLCSSSAAPECWPAATAPSCTGTSCRKLSACWFNS